VTSYCSLRPSDNNKRSIVSAFGYGLSYTTFATSEPELVGSIENGFSVGVVVKNTGNRPGRQVVQVYVSTATSHIDTSTKPIKKTSVLQPRSSERVSVTIPARALSHWSVKDSKWVVPSGTHKILVASSSVAVDHMLEVDVGEDMVL
jgi:beta-glucosidase